MQPGKVVRIAKGYYNTASLYKIYRGVAQSG
jgi:hypothetical protein